MDMSTRTRTFGTVEPDESACSGILLLQAKLFVLKSSRLLSNAAFSPGLTVAEPSPELVEQEATRAVGWSGRVSFFVATSQVSSRIRSEDMSSFQES